MIYNKLFDWQKDIVNKYKNKESLGLWLDMGLGKTPISLALTEINQIERILIITINSKALEDENTPGSFLNWLSLSNINYHFLNKNSKMEQFSTENEVLIINYESLFKRNNKKSKVELKENIQTFIKNSRDKRCAIIIDESHKMKDSSSMQTLSIEKIKKEFLKITNTLYCYLLTGTPFTQGYIDLFTQLKFLGLNITKALFLETFCIRGNLPGLFGWQQPIVGYKNIDHLYEIVHNFALTIKSNEVIDLPEQMFIYLPTEKSEYFDLLTNEKLEGKLIYKYLKNEEFNTKTKVLNPYYRNIDYPDVKYICDTSGNFWLRARQLSIGFQGNAEDYIWLDYSRLNKLENFLKENPDNYLLFYNYTPELIEIFNICEKLGYNIDVYSGEIKSLTFYNKYVKQSKEEQFNNKKNIILANFASGSTGMNWQQYTKCIIFSNPLFKDYEQGIKRIHRIGQQKTVFYYMFYQKNWLDYSMKKALDEQIQYNEKLFEKEILDNEK